MCLAFLGGGPGGAEKGVEGDMLTLADLRESESVKRLVDVRWQ